jgi:hypothetical protein
MLAPRPVSRSPKIPAPAPSLPRAPGARTAQKTPLPDATTVLHTPPLQSLLWHSRTRVQVDPVGSAGVQLPVPEQKSAAEHCVSVWQETPMPPSPSVHSPLSVLHDGTSDGHIADVVHSMQVLDVLQTGVPVGHWELITQASQRPWFWPLVAHTMDRHTLAPSAPVQGPSPFAYPHSLSFVSQTPLLQTSVPAAAVQTPFSVGFVCAVSVGMPTPFASWGVHSWAVSLHQLPEGQSESTLQPPVPWHTPPEPHMPERQTVVPSDAVHGPSPLA